MGLITTKPIQVNRSKKVAVRSANKERQNPKKEKNKNARGRDFCPVFTSFVRAGHERLMPA
jgi:hypothetical protein